MRTLEKRRIKNDIREFFDGERRYTVKGSIVFTFKPANQEVALSSLKKQIKEIDAEFPWKDDTHPHEEFRSIGYLGDDKEVVQNWNTPEKDVWFTIVPLWENLRKSQVYAYEKYLANIAKNLAERGIPGVTSVRSVLHTSSYNTFKSR